MSEDLLYRRDLLRLAADASHAGHLPAPHASATEYNRACGDRVTVELTLEGGRIATLAHDTRACVLTQASAALLAGIGPGRDRAALAALRAVRDEAQGEYKDSSGRPRPAREPFARAIAAIEA